MGSQVSATSPFVAGLLLTSCFVIFAVGGLLFTARNGMAGHPAPSFAYLAVERSFIMAAVIITALGLLALAEIIGRAHDGALIAARLSAAVYAAAAALILFSEVTFLRDGRFPYVIVAMYVVLAFVTEAAFGIILIRTDFLPSWIGWTALVWNITWLMILPIFRPHDVYYPWLHHVTPLVIGIALLRRG